MNARVQRLFASFALAGLLLGGCTASPNRNAPSARANHDEPVPVQPPERFDPYPVVRVRKVLLDGKLAGYLKVRVDETDPLARERVYLVYDGSFALRGFFTENGRVYRVEPDGEVRPLGARPREDTYRVLLGGQPESKVELEAMDPPKTIG